MTAFAAQDAFWAQSTVTTCTSATRSTRLPDSGWKTMPPPIRTQPPFGITVVDADPRRISAPLIRSYLDLRHRVLA